MHVYLYAGTVLFFILLPILFFLLLQAISSQNVRQICISGALAVLTLVASLALFAKDFMEGL
jgi:hypothetical protein